MKKSFIFMFLLFALAMLTAPANGYATPSNCASLFQKDRSLFDKCLTEVCLVFREQKPFIFNDGLETLEDQEPFRCQDRKNQTKGVRGVIFSMIDEMPELSNAYCMWAGPECAFDDLIWFVGNVSKTTKYKLVATGILFMLRYRESIHTTPSASILGDKIVIVGPRQHSLGASGAWRAIWSPFSGNAWVLLITIVAILLTVRVSTVIYYTDPLTFDSFGSNLFGDDSSPSALGIPVCDECKSRGAPGTDCAACQTRGEKAAKREDGLSNMRTLNRNWGQVARLFSVIVIIFYEIAVVNFIFSEQSDTLISGLHPARFVVQQDTTQEHIMRGVMLHNGEVSSGAVPWMRAKDTEELYRAMTAGTEAKYTLSYDLWYRFISKTQRNACEIFEVYKTDQKVVSLPGGWYFGGNVPLEERTKIDGAIADMREKGLVLKLLADYIGTSLPTRCNTRRSIDALVIAFPLVIFLTPHVLRQIYLVGSLWYKAKVHST